MSVQFLVLLVLAALAREQLAAASKFAYTKPLYGKSNFLKEKRFKLRATSTTSAPTSTTTAPTTTPTTTTTEGAWPSSVEFIIKTSPKTRTATEPTDASIESSSSSSISSFTSTTPSSVPSTTAGVEHDLEPGSSSSASNTITTTVTSTTPSSLVNTLPSPPTPASTTAPTVAADNQPVPCTCGVFLSSQIRNGLPDKPLIHNEMDRMYPCNAIGRKQCQTKCLETVSVTNTHTHTYTQCPTDSSHSRLSSICPTRRTSFAPRWATIATRSARICSSRIATTNGLIRICRRAASIAARMAHPIVVHCWVERNKTENRLKIKCAKNKWSNSIIYRFLKGVIDVR